VSTANCPSASHPAPFQIDHIIARQHGGATELENLALACIHCNRFKGPNMLGLIRIAAKSFAYSIPGAIPGRNTLSGMGLD
jgi:hypothetical protein